MKGIKLLGLGALLSLSMMTAVASDLADMVKGQKELYKDGNPTFFCDRFYYHSTPSFQSPPTVEDTLVFKIHFANIDHAVEERYANQNDAVSVHTRFAGEIIDNKTIFETVVSVNIEDKDFCEQHFKTAADHYNEVFEEMGHEGKLDSLFSVTYYYNVVVQD